MLAIAENNYCLGVGMKRAKTRTPNRTGSPYLVTADEVLKRAEEFGEAAWTTTELAAKMGLPEYCIRASVACLLDRRQVEAQPTKERRYTAETHRPYMVTTYKVIERFGEPDISALEMALGFCRAFIKG